MFVRRLDQLFLRPSQGGTEALLVLETPAGARQRVRLPLSERDPDRALARVARHLAARPERVAVEGVRVRVERSGELRDEPRLARRLADALRRLDEP